MRSSFSYKKIRDKKCNRSFRSEEVLAELQFSFICFLVGQHYDSFEHWKQLLRLFCSADDALVKYADMYLTLITDMHFQVNYIFFYS